MVPEVFDVFVQTLVPGTTTTALLQQLVPDTEYNVGVVAVYSDGEGPIIAEEGKTRKSYDSFNLVRWTVTLNSLGWKKINKKLFSLFPLSVPRGGPRNMNVYDPTTSTLSVTWEHADGPVMQYRITYAPTVGDPIDEYVRIFKLHLKKNPKGSLDIFL